MGFGFCQAISATILAKIVPSETYLQTPLIQDILYPTDTTIGHALTVVRLPITKNDAVLMKAYLIDASFSQFIFPHPDLKDYEFKKKLFASEAGKSLAEKLLRDGFIPLTEEAASALLLASSNTTSLLTITQDSVEIFFGKSTNLVRGTKAEKPEDQTERNLGIDFGEKELSEIWGVDFRPPSEVISADATAAGTSSTISKILENKKGR